MKTLILSSLPSTHTWIKENASQISPDTLVIAIAQTGGRGQRGNSWESQPGKNLTFSFIHHPQNIPPRLQFAISEAVAAAIHSTLGHFGISAKIKWPNDIYVLDKKICGILIEHSVSNPDSIDRTIAGAGININQTIFRSDAPNPTSMALLKGHEFDIEEVTGKLCLNLDHFLPLISSEEGRETLHQYFMQNLYWGDGEYHPFRIVKENIIKKGKIAHVDHTGEITLSFDDDSKGSFAFKEIEFIH